MLFHIRFFLLIRHFHIFKIKKNPGAFLFRGNSVLPEECRDQSPSSTGGFPPVLNTTCDKTNFFYFFFFQLGIHL